MISTILKYIKDLILDFTNYIIHTPDYLRWFYKNIIFFIDDQKIKYRDILRTNIELGKHHLFRGKISDALFRFRAAHFLFDTQNKEINYWLGWCHFLNSNYDSAIAYLEDSKEYDKDHLLAFIKSIKHATIVPDALWNIMRTINAAQDGQYKISINKKTIDLPLEFVQFCMNKLEHIKPGTEILDYGCGAGMVGSMMDHIISPEYQITAVENLDIFLDYIDDLDGDRGHIYDEIIEQSPIDAHKKLEPHTYDIITCFDSLIFTKDLHDHFTSFYNALSKKGHLAILLPLASQTEWSQNNRAFVFSQNDIEEKLKLAKFNILDIKKWKLSANKSFIGIICTK